MITETLFIFILLIHFLADFGLQTNEQAIGKSTDIEQLFYHVGVYSLIWFFASLTFFDFWNALGIAAITFVAHYVTDYTTSRIGKPYWERKDMHNGFVVVGFDQMLHYIQLYYTFKLFL